MVSPYCAPSGWFYEFALQARGSIMQHTRLYRPRIVVAARVLARRVSTRRLTAPVPRFACTCTLTSTRHTHPPTHRLVSQCALLPKRGPTLQRVKQDNPKTIHINQAPTPRNTDKDLSLTRENKLIGGPGGCRTSTTAPANKRTTQ